MTPETLRKYGWQRIASDAHAAQLLRHELKHHAQWQQRGRAATWDYRTLLAIKRGNWFTFVGNEHNGNCSLVVYRMPTNSGAAAGGE